MKAEGAEATMIFIHWGEEYELKENTAQQKMAQKLCDIGFDVIVGGHAHVVQPMALLESTVDPDHKTVCIYSMGNAVSNQRTGVSDQFPTGYTEDGALFTVSFEKYSDGKVYVSGTDVVPTWVNMHSNKGAREYNILPLTKDTEQQWQSSYELTDQQLKSCQKSYDRTMGIVGEGLEVCQAYLAQAKEAREEYYYNLAYNPELLETEATQEPVAEETTLPAA
ncbi:CapA family protein, partial [Succinimonas sp.]|uniref:CapA family protein n=1 Tax=Succinimonas sp. TaxID=1936151 RepID=UPI00386620DB